MAAIGSLLMIRQSEPQASCYCIGSKQNGSNKDKAQRASLESNPYSERDRSLATKANFLARRRRHSFTFPPVTSTSTWSSIYYLNGGGRDCPVEDDEDALYGNIAFLGGCERNSTSSCNGGKDNLSPSSKSKLPPRVPSFPRGNSKRGKLRSSTVSFGEDVEVITIPSCTSYDDSTKKSMWYTSEEFEQMVTASKLSRQP